MSDIPATWISAILGDIAHVEMGQSPDSRFYNERGEGLPFFQGKAEFGKLYPTVRKWCSEPKKIAEAGDILLSVRAPVGPTNLAEARCCIGRGLASIRASAPIVQKYLLHFFRNIQPWLSEQGTGTTFAAVSGDFVRGLEVGLAPLTEQKRIADKLDAVLARVDACRERLDRVPALLKRFRQSVLASGISGKLTVEWRASDDKRMDTEPPDWPERPLAELCERERVITYGVIKLGAEVPTGVPCLRTSNVRWLRVDTEGMRRIALTLSSEYARTILRGGEVLVNVRGTLGGVAVATPEMIGWNVSREVAVVPVDASQVDPSYLAFWIGSEVSQRWLSRVEKGVAYIGINIEDLRNLPVRLPPLEEQREIVTSVESLLAYADRLEARYTAGRAYVDRLTSALLTKAFRGELVPQDPNDEPASLLLQRIRTARAATPDKAKRGKGGRNSEKSKTAEVLMLDRKDIRDAHLTTILKEPLNNCIGSTAAGLSRFFRNKLRIREFKSDYISLPWLISDISFAAIDFR